VIELGLVLLVFALYGGWALFAGIDSTVSKSRERRLAAARRPFAGAGENRTMQPNQRRRRTGAHNS